MIEYNISLTSSGAAKLAGCENLLRFGYQKNCGVYRLRVAAGGEWQGMTIRAFWHTPSGGTFSTLVEEGAAEVPAVITAAPGEGSITFEGSNGTKTLTSADIRYRVAANTGTEDGSMPQPESPAWQQLVSQVEQVGEDARQSAVTARRAAEEAKNTGDAAVKAVKKAETDALNAIEGAGGSGGSGSSGAAALTPEQYGAAGDGVTDDSAALQDAIDAASEQNQPLQLTHGKNYLFKTGLTLKSDLHIVGNGATLTSEVTGGNAMSGWGQQTEHLHDFKMEDLRFTASDADTCAYMLVLARTTDVVLRNVTFYSGICDCNRCCLDLFGANQNVLLENCTFYQLSASREGGIWVRNWNNNLLETEHTKNIRFLHCDFYKAGGDEVLAVWGWKGVVRDVLISGCNFYEVDEEKYTSRGYYPKWFITLGQTGTTYARMENCVVRASRCECIFRMLFDGTHAVVDNCDIYYEQASDVPEHDMSNSANQLLAQGNRDPQKTIISNCRCYIRADNGRRITYSFGKLLNNVFDAELGGGAASTVEVVGNTFKGKFERNIFNDCSIIKNNIIEAEVPGFGLAAGAGAIEGNRYTLTITRDNQGGEIFRNNWGSGTIKGNLIALTCTAEEGYTVKKYNFPGKGTEYIEDNIVTIEGPVEYDSPHLKSILNGTVYRKNNYFNGVREPLFECTGVSFAEQARTEPYKKYTQLEAVISPANCTDPIIYAWDNADGAVQDMGDGQYLPVKDGTAKATVTCGAFSASQTITVALVPVACEGLKLSRSRALCGAGSTTYLKAFATPYWTTDSIVWKSDAEDVATVTQDGEVTTLKIGSANITATCGSHTASCALNVVDASELPTYTDGEWVLDNTVAYVPMPDFADEHTVYAAFDVDVSCVGQNEELPLITSLLSGQTGQEALCLAFGGDGNSYKSIRWYTTGATANEDDKVTLHRVMSVNNGFKEGKAASTAFLYLNSGVANLNGTVVWGAENSEVKAAPESGYLSFNVQTSAGDSPITDYTSGAALAAALKSGDIHATKATGFKLRELIVFTNSSYDNLDDIKQYRESAEIDLRFDENGSVVNAGTAGDFIIAGKGGDVAPTIPVSSVTLNKTALNLAVGESDTLTAKVLPTNATNKSIMWDVPLLGSCITYSSSKNTEVTVTGRTEGSCTIKAAAGGKSAECTVTVKAAESGNTNPFPSVTPAYLLPTEETFVPADAESIDTGVKLFEALDPAPTFTILMEAQAAETTAEKSGTYTLMHCMEEADPWPGLVVQVGGANMKLNVYRNSPDFGSVALWKSKKCRAAVRVNSGVLTGWCPVDSGTSYALAWGTIKEMNDAVDKTLILGAYQASDGTKGRYFDGTLYQCVVYKSALTDEQISGWVNNT